MKKNYLQSSLDVRVDKYQPVGKQPFGQPCIWCRFAPGLEGQKLSLAYTILKEVRNDVATL